MEDNRNKEKILSSVNDAKNKYGEILKAVMIKQIEKSKKNKE